MSLIQRNTASLPDSSFSPPPLSSSPSDNLSDKYARHEKPLILFSSIDITSYSKMSKYFILLGGLVFFMCGYGYYQELVIYGWFDRKLSFFSTFLHFLGCSALAQLQRNALKRNSNPYKNNSSSSFNCLVASSLPSSSSSMPSPHESQTPAKDKEWWKISMGIASFSVSVYYYFLLVVLKFIAQIFSNLSMTEITYPVKVLFKSMNPMVTIVIGTLFLRKKYKILDYLVVILLVLGLFIFITADSNKISTSESSLLGIFYVLLSVFASASGPMIQENAIHTYHASVEDLLYFSFLGSTFLSFFCALGTGEMNAGISFLFSALRSTLLNEDNHSLFYHLYQILHTVLIFFAFTTFAYCGALFSTAITQQYGALVNGIANTFRKMLTVLLSFLLFPDRNHMTTSKAIGCAIFFLGLILKTLMKNTNKLGTNNKKINENYENVDIESGTNFFTKSRKSSPPTSPSSSIVLSSPPHPVGQGVLNTSCSSTTVGPPSVGVVGGSPTTSTASSTSSSLYNRFATKLDSSSDPLLDNLMTIETTIED